MPHPGLVTQRRLSARSMRQISASYGLGWLRWLLVHQCRLAEALGDAANIDSSPSSA